MRAQVTNLSVADKYSLECLAQQALNGIYCQNLLDTFDFRDYILFREIGNCETSSQS